MQYVSHPGFDEDMEEDGDDEDEEEDWDDSERPLCHIWVLREKFDIDCIYLVASKT